MHLFSKNMNPSMITLRDSKPGDDTTAALDALQEIREGSEQGSSAASDTDMALKFEAISCDIQGVRKSQDRLNKDLDVLNIKYRRDNMVIMEALQEYTLRCDALEQQLTNFTELHQKEIANLKEKLSRIEEHVDYKARLKTELQGAPEACHTTAWIVLRKVLSVLLVVLTAFWVYVSSLSHSDPV